jgi:ribose 5-phosphate isomerase
MKVKTLLHHLTTNYQPDDDIVVTWYDEQYCVENLSTSAVPKEIMEQAWKEIADEAQETVEGHLDFTQTGYEILEMFEEKITELLQEEENNA